MKIQAVVFVAHFGCLFGFAQAHFICVVLVEPHSVFTSHSSTTVSKQGDYFSGAYSKLYVGNIDPILIST